MKTRFFYIISYVRDEHKDASDSVLLPYTVILVMYLNVYSNGYEMGLQQGTEPDRSHFTSS